MYLLVHLLSAFCETDVMGDTGSNGNGGGVWGGGRGMLLRQGCGSLQQAETSYYSNYELDRPVLET